MIIRRPKPEDAERLAEMVDALNRHEGEATGLFTAAAALADIIAPDAPVHGFVAEAAGTLTGFALWHFAYDTAMAGRGGFLADLFVEDSHRGTGTADALLKAVAQDVDAGGGTFLWWGAYASNVRARTFYRRYASDEEDGIVTFNISGERFARLVE
ncbi:MAG: GNAT family N-acetyltransferase [Pseudomonadota bacterium]